MSIPSRWEWKDYVKLVYSASKATLYGQHQHSLFQRRVEQSNLFQVSDTQISAWSKAAPNFKNSRCPPEAKWNMICYVARSEHGLLVYGLVRPRFIVIMYLNNIVG